MIMGLLKNLTHHIKQSNKPWRFFAESIGILKDDIENIGKNENPNKEFVHALTRKIWSEILEVGDIKYQDYSHYTQISSVIQVGEFLVGHQSKGQAAMGEIAENNEKSADGSKDIQERGHGTIIDENQDIQERGHGTIIDDNQVAEGLKQWMVHGTINDIQGGDNFERGHGTINQEKGFTLYDACKTDDFTLLKKYCDERKIDIKTYKDETTGANLLHIASYTNAVNISQELIGKYDIPVNSTDKCRSTPLHFAFFKNNVCNVDVVKLLIKNNARPDLKNNQGLIPIHMVAQRGQIDIIKYIFDCPDNFGAVTKMFSMFNYDPIDMKDGKGMTPLHYAVENKHIEVVKYLIENGADVNILNNNDKTPLHIAAFDCAVEITRYLIQKGAKVDQKDCIGATPLLYAALRGDVNIIKILIDNGADINMRNYDGNTALHETIKVNKNKTCEFLCDNGIDVNAQNDNGDTALHIAVGKEYFDICKLLCEKGAKINIKNKKQETPMQRAFHNQNIYELFRKVLEKESNSSLI